MDWQQEVKKAAGGAIKDLKKIPTRLSCMAARKPGARESIEAKLETKGDPTSDTAVLLAKSAPRYSAGSRFSTSTRVFILRLL